MGRPVALGMGLWVGDGVVHRRKRGQGHERPFDGAREGPGRRSSKGPPVGLGGGQLLAHKLQRHVLLGGVAGGVGHVEALALGSDAGAVGPQPVPAIERKRLLQRRNCCGKGRNKGAGGVGFCEGLGGAGGEGTLWGGGMGL